MVKLVDFLSKFEKIKSVKSNYKNGKLFESICVLIKKEANNPKTVSAIELLLNNYAKMEEKIKKYNNMPYSVLEIDLLDVPESVAKAINKRAEIIDELNKKSEQETQEKIINLLKFDADLQK